VVVGDNVAEFQRTLDINSEGADFDSTAFMRSVMQTIEVSRSNMTRIADTIVDSPAGQGTSGLAESRLNAFYRLIGLPAMRDENLLNDVSKTKLNVDNKRREKLLSQDNTLNYFSSSGANGTATNTSLASREALNLRFAKPSSVDFNEMVNNPLSIDESLKQSSTRRISIFPMVVDASVPVYPLDRRVAPLFHDGDYILNGGRARLRRPLLQHIIYLRTKVFSGTQSGIEDKLRTNILNEIGEGIISEQAIKNYKFLELRIIQKLIETLKQSANNYNKAKSSIKFSFNKEILSG
jgi:hypothetical protein